MRRKIKKQKILKHIMPTAVIFLLLGCSNSESDTVSDDRITESSGVDENYTKNEAERILSELKIESDGSGDNEFTDTNEKKSAQSESVTSESESDRQGRRDENIIDTKSLYKKYFSDNHDMNDIVCLADVTHDGMDEMIVVHRMEDQNIEGYVYTVKAGQVSEIYEKRGAEVHAGGFFAWYLVDKGDYFNLSEEGFGMWQGRGEVDYSEYYLSEEGGRTEVYSIMCPSDDSEIDEEGYVKDDAFDRYVAELGKLENISLIYASNTEGVKPKRMITNGRAFILGDEYEGVRKPIEKLNDNDKKVLSLFASSVWNAYYDQASFRKDDMDNKGWYNIEDYEAYMISRILVMTMPELFGGEKDDFGIKMKTEDLAAFLHDCVGVPQEKMCTYLNSTEDADAGYINLFGGDYGEVYPVIDIKEMYIDDDDYIILNGDLGEKGYFWDLDADVNNMIPFSMKFCYIGDGGLKGFRFYELVLKDNFTSIYYDN